MSIYRSLLTIESIVPNDDEVPWKDTIATGLR